MGDNHRQPAVPYSTFAVIDLLDSFASSDPVPGGGSAAALAGAIGVSLLIMVAAIAKTRTGAPEETADLAEVSARLRPLRETLMSLIDGDSEAYADVVSAMRLPRASEPDVRARSGAVEAAMRRATDVPLDTMRACQQALEGSVVVAAKGNRRAASDANVGIELLLAGLRGAAMNVDVNLQDVSDAGFVARAREERRQLEQDAVAAASQARAALA